MRSGRQPQLHSMENQLEPQLLIIMASTFESFPSLPIELRMKVWEGAVESRVIEVHWRSLEGFTFHTYPPALLSVSRESRAVTYPIFHDSSMCLPAAYAFFNWDRDILYFPYPFKCSTSYGRSLETFLTRLERSKDLRHLALALPLQEPKNELSTTKLNERDPLFRQMGTNKDSMTFATRIQAIARRAGSLFLESITLVFEDPILCHPEGKPTYMDPGVARTFTDIKTSDENPSELWKARTENFQWRLTLPHDDNDFNNAGNLPPGTPRNSRNTWGTPEVYMKKVDRRHLKSVHNQDGKAPSGNSWQNEWSTMYPDLEFPWSNSESAERLGSNYPS